MERGKCVGGSGVEGTRNREGNGMKHCEIAIVSERERGEELCQRRNWKGDRQGSSERWPQPATDMNNSQTKKKKKKKKKKGVRAVGSPPSAAATGVSRCTATACDRHHQAFHPTATMRLLTLTEADQLNRRWGLFVLF